MCISHLGQKVTTWVSRDYGDHLGQTQVISSYYLGQSYHLGRNSDPALAVATTALFSIKMFFWFAVLILS